MPERLVMHSQPKKEFQWWFEKHPKLKVGAHGQ